LFTPFLFQKPKCLLCIDSNEWLLKGTGCMMDMLGPLPFGGAFLLHSVKEAPSNLLPFLLPKDNLQ
jgi:hypothetical protein